MRTMTNDTHEDKTDKPYAVVIICFFDSMKQS